MFGQHGRRLPELSFLGDHFDGSVVHLVHRDVTFLAFHERRYRRSKPSRREWAGGSKWVSSFGSDFNRDYHVSFTNDERENGKVYYNYEMTEFPSEEGPGVSVFYKDPKRRRLP